MDNLYDLLDELFTYTKLQNEDYKLDMEKYDITQVFDRFYKADKSRNEKSTGLGLAIAKEMVEKMGGTIEAELIDRRFIIKISFDVI